MKVTAHEVAKYIIADFQGAEELITNMKVQKLLYYVQGWHLGIYGTPVFEQEFQAWVHGPVQKEVYDEYKDYKGTPIIKSIAKPQLDQSLVNHIEEVLECYGGMGALELEHLTHKERPWLEARDDLNEDQPSQNIISTNTMKEYFTKLSVDNEKNHNYEPNKETIKVLEESKRGIDINEYSSWEDMIVKIEKEIVEESKC